MKKRDRSFLRSPLGFAVIAVVFVAVIVALAGFFTGKRDVLTSPGTIRYSCGVNVVVGGYGEGRGDITELYTSPDFPCWRVDCGAPWLDSSSVDDSALAQCYQNLNQQIVDKLLNSHCPQGCSPGFRFTSPCHIIRFEREAYSFAEEGNLNNCRCETVAEAEGYAEVFCWPVQQVALPITQTK